MQTSQRRSRAAKYAAAVLIGAVAVGACSQGNVETPLPTNGSSTESTTPTITTDAPASASSSTIEITTTTSPLPEYAVSIQEGPLPDYRRVLGETTQVDTESGNMALSLEGNGAAFVCGSQIIYISQSEDELVVADYQRIVDYEAGTRSCTPFGIAPIECLGLPLDPIACDDGHEGG